MNPMFVEVTDQWGTTKQKRRVRASPKNPSKITRMNEAVFQWFKLQRSMNLEVDNGQLCDKALMYSQILKVSLHFTASRGWLTRFKERHGIADIKSTHQCKIDTDKVFVSHLKASLRQDNLTPGQVYCVDETVLLWREPPPSAPPDHIPGTMNKDKLTIITCTNMDATHKLSLNIVGPYTEPVVEGGGLSGTSPSCTTRHSVGLQTDEETDPLVSSVTTPSPTPSPNSSEQQQQHVVMPDAVTSVTMEDSIKSSASSNEEVPSSGGPLSEQTSCSGETMEATPTTKVQQPEHEQQENQQQQSPQHVIEQQTQQQPMLLYRKGDTHELTGDIFADWFYSTFVPQVKSSLAARGLPPHAVLILDNSLYHAVAQLTDSSGKIKTIRVPCYVANKSLPSATISKSLKLGYKTRIAKEWIQDKEFCNNLNLRRCFEMLKEEWGEVNNITATWKHWYQIEPVMAPSNQQFIQLADLLNEIPPILVKQWISSDDRPSEVPLRIPNELELLDIATEICHARLGPIAGLNLIGEEGKNSMIEVTSDYLESETSPPSYDEALSSSTTDTVLHNKGETVEQTFCKRRSGPEKRQKTEMSPSPLLMSASKPIISPHPQSIIDNILRASMMTSLPGSITSPNLQPPFSPLSPSPTFPETWPALHALMGITNANPKIVSKNDALMGLDKFIAFIEQQPNVASILKDVLYEFKKYAVHKL